MVGPDSFFDRTNYRIVEQTTKICFIQSHAIYRTYSALERGRAGSSRRPRAAQDGRPPRAPAYTAFPAAHAAARRSRTPSPRPGSATTG